MTTERRKYDEEFQRRAVRLSYDPERTVQSVIGALGISNSMLYRWRKKYSAEGEKTPEANQLEELRRLRKRNAELEEENDILKKAMAIFATK